MKKLFTLIAAVLFGVLSMNAADYKLSLTDLGSGGDNSSYNSVSQTITFDEAWACRGWWFDTKGVDLSSYDQVVVNFSDPLPMQVNLIVEYAKDADADMGYEQVTANAGEKSVTLNLDSKKKPIMQIYLQGITAGKVVLKDAYLTLEDKTAAYKLSLEDGVTDGICYEYDEGDYEPTTKTITLPTTTSQCGWMFTMVGKDFSAYDSLIIKTEPLATGVTLRVEYGEGADMKAEEKGFNKGETELVMNLISVKKKIVKILFCTAVENATITLKDAYLTYEIEEPSNYYLRLKNGVTDGINYSKGAADFDDETSTMTFPDAETQCGWMFTTVGKDFSDYDKVVIETEPLTSDVRLRVVYGEGADMSTEATLVKKGATELSLEMDSEKKQIVQILVEAVEANTSVVLKSAYLTPATSTGISSAAIAPAKNVDTRVFNLAGQQVDKAYKGIVIKNGKKYVQK